MCIVILTKIFVFFGIIWYHMIPLPLSPFDPLHGRYGQYETVLKFHLRDPLRQLLGSKMQNSRILFSSQGLPHHSWRGIITSIMSDFEEKENNSGDDDEDLMDLLFLYHVSDAFTPAENGEKQRQRRPRWIHKRLNWAEHLRKLHHERAFDRTYRMLLFDAFNRLLDLLRDDLMTTTATQHGGYHDTDAVEPELIMAIGIRLLAGGSYVDIRHVYGCSVASVFRFRDMFLDAVLNCKALDIVFPVTNEDLKSTAVKFANNYFAPCLHSKRQRTMCFVVLQDHHVFHLEICHVILEKISWYHVIPFMGGVQTRYHKSVS